MTGIYGDMLSAFPELMQKYSIYSMTPLKSGGYKDRTFLVSVSGILLYVRGGQLLLENETIKSTDQPFLWSRSVIEVGKFVMDGNSLYRIVGDNNQKKTGNFIMYSLQSVVGTTDTQAPFDAGMINALRHS